MLSLPHAARIKERKRKSAWPSESSRRRLRNALFLSPLRRRGEKKERSRSLGFSKEDRTFTSTIREKRKERTIACACVCTRLLLCSTPAERGKKEITAQSRPRLKKERWPGSISFYRDRRREKGKEKMAAGDSEGLRSGSLSSFYAELAERAMPTD